MSPVSVARGRGVMADLRIRVGIARLQLVREAEGAVAEEQRRHDQ
jgi:hypothetical protein